MHGRLPTPFKPCSASGLSRQGGSWQSPEFGKTLGESWLALPPARSMTWGAFLHLCTLFPLGKTGASACPSWGTCEDSVRQRSMPCLERRPVPPSRFPPPASHPSLLTPGAAASLTSGRLAWDGGGQNTGEGPGSPALITVLLSVPPCLPVLVSWGFCNKWPQAGWLKTTGMCPPNRGRGRKPGIRASAGRAPLAPKAPGSPSTFSSF